MGIKLSKFMLLQLYAAAFPFAQVISVPDSLLFCATALGAHPKTPSTTMQNIERVI